MKPGPERSVCLIYGQTGSGKSVLARAVAQAMARAKAAPLLVIDTLDEYLDLAAISPESVKSWAINNRGNGAVSIRVLCPGEDELEAVFSGLFAAYDEKPGPVVVLIDEVSYWTRPNYVAPGLEEAIRYGRHKAISLIAVARRPAETARALSTQATELRVFKVIERVDLDYFNRSMPPEIIEKLPTLDKYHSLTYVFDGGYTLQPPVKVIRTR